MIVLMERRWVMAGAAWAVGVLWVGEQVPAALSTHSADWLRLVLGAALVGFGFVIQPRQHA